MVLILISDCAIRTSLLQEFILQNLFFSMVGPTIIRNTHHFGFGSWIFSFTLSSVLHVSYTRKRSGNVMECPMHPRTLLQGKKMTFRHTGVCLIRTHVARWHVKEISIRPLLCASRTKPSSMESTLSTRKFACSFKREAFPCPHGVTNRSGLIRILLDVDLWVLSPCCIIWFLLVINSRSEKVTGR